MLPLVLPSASGQALFKGNEVLGLVDNEVFGTLETEPKHGGLTLNSDTPYAPLLLDLRAGPMVIERPPGPLIGGDVHAGRERLTTVKVHPLAPIRGRKTPSSWT